MRFITWGGIRTLFQGLCYFVATLMVSYWVYRFWIEDADVITIDYKGFETIDDAELPVLSICFENPFLDKKLKEINADINQTSYLSYLKGDIFDEKFNDISYENVTLNLSDFLLGTDIVWKNGSLVGNSGLGDLDNSADTSSAIRLDVTFNGFWFRSFVKCFGVQLVDKYKEEVYYISQFYKQNEFLDGFNRSSGNGLIIILHYPKQFLHAKTIKEFWGDRTTKTDYGYRFTITDQEIFKRRNKRRESCMNNWKHYDDEVLEQHIKHYGCRAPYHANFKQFPLCSTKQQIKESIYEVSFLQTQYSTMPCQSMSRVDFVFSDDDFGGNGTEFVLEISYPYQLKIITQSKAVDIHTLIGNIGGYIGLFIGKFH